MFFWSLQKNSFIPIELWDGGWCFPQLLWIRFCPASCQDGCLLVPLSPCLLVSLSLLISHDMHTSMWVAYYYVISFESIRSMTTPVEGATIDPHLRGVDLLRVPTWCRRWIFLMKIATMHKFLLTNVETKTEEPDRRLYALGVTCGVD